ncbi:MAG TPA: DNA recombination protein RmuC [Puia sp.]|nr:DNA recombination protein RmuC [Puia sp.]
MSVTIALLLVCLVLSVITIALVLRSTAEFGRIDRLIRDEFSRSREENYKTSQSVRAELEDKLERIRTTTESHQEKTRAMLESHLDKIRTTLEGSLEKTRVTMEASLEKTRVTMEVNMERTRQTMENKLKTLQDDNAKKLEEMRATVDEKLQSTVEKRFNDSFKLISDRLEQVHKGLGEMQTLASGVGDLKKVLTNVKTRGNLGEIQLGAILEEIFAADHYEHNAIVRAGSQERVEYVIKLPGKNDDNQSLLLPIDSKFPNEDYQRLLEAYDNMAGLDPKQVDAIGRQFEAAVKKSAKDIREKYINPPTTTDFAILFVPTEGLYAEILRRAGLFETLRRDFKVTVVGPTNLVAFLNSLQMGFRTLAIGKRSSEVWEILGAVKTEFGNFSVILDKTRKKLQEATNTIDQAGVRTRAIERQLRKVQELPQEDAAALLGQDLDLDMEGEQI